MFYYFGKSGFHELYTRSQLGEDGERENESDTDLKCIVNNREIVPGL